MNSIYAQRRLIFGIGALLAFAFAALFFRNDLATSRWLFTNTTYYFIGFLYFLCVVFAFQVRQIFVPLLTDRKTWVVILFSFASVVVMQRSLKPQYRVLSDETNIIAVSQSLFYTKQAKNVTQGKWYYETFHELHETVPKRPISFAFMINLAHSLFGYSYENAFIVNGFLVFFILVLAGLWFYQCSNLWLGLTAIAALLSQPVLWYCGTSAGFETMNFCWLLVCSLLLHKCLKSSSTHLAMLLWINLLILANIRYESFVYIAPFLGAMLLWNRQLINQTWQKHPVLVIASTFCTLPRFWQFSLTTGRYSESDGKLFSIEFFGQNLHEWLRVWFYSGHMSPYAGVTNALALTLIIVLIVNLKKSSSSKSGRHLAAVFVACFLGTMIIFLNHYFGKSAHAAAYRFYLAPALAWTLFGVAGLIHLPKKWQQLSLPFALTSFIFHTSIASKAEIPATLTLTRTTHTLYDFLLSQSDQATLLISDRPGQYTVLNRSSVNFSYANKHRNELINNLKNGLYSKILVAQKADYATKRLTHELHADYKLKPVMKFQHSGSYFIKISEVVTSNELPKQKTKE